MRSPPAFLTKAVWNSVVSIHRDTYQTFVVCLFYNTLAFLPLNPNTHMNPSQIHHFAQLESHLEHFPPSILKEGYQLPGFHCPESCLTETDSWLNIWEPWGWGGASQVGLRTSKKPRIMGVIFLEQAEKEIDTKGANGHTNVCCSSFTENWN